MKRRDFLYAISLLFSTPFLAKNNDTITSLEIIDKVLVHLLPPQLFSHITPSNFLHSSINQKYFDKNNFNFLLHGAKKLYQFDNNFIYYPSYKKEKILRKYEQTPLGAKWLNSLLSISLEAILSDPIYGGNTNATFYKLLSHNAGVPYPKKRYIYGL